MQVECDYSQNRALLSAFQVTHGHFLQQNTRSLCVGGISFILRTAAPLREKYKVSCRDEDNAARYIRFRALGITRLCPFYRFSWMVAHFLLFTAEKKMHSRIGPGRYEWIQAPDQQQSHKYEIGFAFMMCLIF
jgi:hypothetical protein